MNTLPRIAILGTVGLPARYGGFETLAANLVREAEARGMSRAFTVYCSAPQSGPDRPATWHGATLKYLPLRANGVQSIPYDILSMLLSALGRQDVLLLLGVSGAVGLPVIRRLTRARICVHIDGLEWQRAKFSPRAQRFLKTSEAMAIRHADDVIADNDAIAAHVRATYGVEPTLLTYGGDTPAPSAPAPAPDPDLPDRFALVLARAEPENNLEMILSGFATTPGLPPLVAVSNWQANAYGRALWQRFANTPGLHLRPPIYDPAKLTALRNKAAVYIHGHSAGGTNPALVEMMHHGTPILAFDCVFNRATTEDQATYFADPAALTAAVTALDADGGVENAARMAEIADRRYRWADVAAGYFRLLGLQPSSPGESTGL